MPSDESGRGTPSKPPSSSGAPPSSSEPPPAELIAWGPVRNAITSIHNLEVLLKSPRVAPKVLEGVLPELFDGATVLRRAFTAAAQGAKHPEALAARKALAAFATERLDELDRAMKSASTSELDARGRLALEQVVTRVTVDLNSAAELLDLSERAECAVPTELALDELVWVSIRANGRGADREVAVRLSSEEADCVLRTDPHVFKRLVAFAVARVHAAGAQSVTVRVSCGDDSARIEIRPTSDAEMRLVASNLRVARRIAPTDAIVAAAARSGGIESTEEGGAITLAVPRVA